MASNPYVNKVEFGNQTVMDITDTTAEAADVASGEVFYSASGARSVGTADYYSPSDTAETAIDDADYFPYYDSSASAKRKTLWSNIKSVLKTYFDGHYRKKDFGTFDGNGNSATYCLVCTITIIGFYANRPIEIALQERGRSTIARLNILFASAGNLDPALSSFTVLGGQNVYYICKTDTSEWKVFAEKNESYSIITVVDCTLLSDRISVAWDLSNYTGSLPSGNVKATSLIPTIPSVVSTSADGLAPMVTDTSKYLKGDGTWATPDNTKNTAGSTDTSSKIYLIGATSQAANPKTYSNDEVYATNGVLTARKLSTKGILALTGTGTAGQDKGSGSTNRYVPALWTFNANPPVADGEVYFIKIPVAGGTYGVWLSLDNGTTYYPVAISNGSGRFQTHSPINSVIAVSYESAGVCNCYAMSGADSRTDVTGCFRVVDSYDSGNTTYSAMSTAELTTGTVTTSRVVRSDYLKSGINTLIENKIVDNLTSTATTSALSANQGKVLDTNKCENSVIAPVENGSTASQAYAVGAHFIRDGAFCTAKTAIASGETFTLNTNYTAGNVGDMLVMKDSPLTINANYFSMEKDNSFTINGKYFISARVKCTALPSSGSSVSFFTFPSNGRGGMVIPVYKATQQYGTAGTIIYGYVGDNRIEGHVSDLAVGNYLTIQYMTNN